MAYKSFAAFRLRMYAMEIQPLLKPAEQTILHPHDDISLVLPVRPEYAGEPYLLPARAVPVHITEDSLSGDDLKHLYVQWTY